MSYDLGGREDDQGDGSFHNIDFEFEWFGEPTFKDVLDDCSTGTSGYDQVTFAGEASVFLGAFVPDTVLMARSRMGQFNDPPNEDSPATMSSPGWLLPYNPASQLVKSDLDTFRMKYGLPDLAWLRLPLNGERVD